MANQPGGTPGAKEKGNDKVAAMMDKATTDAGLDESGKLILQSLCRKVETPSSHKKKIPESGGLDWG